MFEATRIVYETVEIRHPGVATFLQSVRQAVKNGRPVRIQGAPRESELVPLPLSADFWADAILRKRIAREDIVLAILSDRQASLICHGLGSLDDATLEYFAGH